MAERSVSISLRARVTDFIAGMGQASKSTQDLSRQMTQTGAHADQFRRRLEAATKALPQIKIDADSTPAEIKFAQLRAEMEKLADKKIGIDIDAGAAQAQLQEIQRELEALERNETSIDVKADIGTALAELRAVDAEVSRLNGQDARVAVDADVGGALASIAMVGAALASLPAVTTVAVGVMALGSAFAAAGVGAAAFSAVAVPSLGRINEALKAQETAAKGAGAATGGAGQSAAQAAQQALQLEQAEKRLKDAQAERKLAQEDLTRAVEAGRRALEDMNFSLERSILSQKDASLAVREAEARLAELQNKDGVSDLEIERAMLSVEMAHQRAREQEVKTQRAKKDTAAANKEGVKGTAEYQKGLDKLTQAEEKVTQATAALKQMQLQQQAAMSGGGGAAAKLKDAFADLSAQEKVLAKDIKAFKDEYIAWQQSLQPEVFPVIAQGLDLMRLGLREAGPLAQSASTAFLQLGKDASASLNGPFWQQFLFNVNTQMPTAITGLGRSFGNVVTGIAGVIDAFLPFTPTVVGGLEKATAAFSLWGQNLDQNPQFKEFIQFVKDNAPDVWELIKNLASALLNIGEAVGPLGVGAMAGLNLLASIVAEMDPARIQAIALAIGAIKLATMGMAAVSAWQNLAGGITAVGGAAGKTGGKMAALGKAAIGLGVAVVGLEATGSVIAYLEGQSAGIDKLTLSLTELGQTGKWAGDLERQWAGALGDSQAAVEGFRNDLAALEDPGWYETIFLHPFTELGALLPGIDSSVDRVQQRFTDLDTALAGMVTNGNADMAAKAFAQFATQAEAQGIPVEKLRNLLPLYGQAVRVAGNASAEAAAGVDQAKVRLDGFNQSLTAFASRTDALQAMQNLKGAYKEAEAAIEAANGKLQVSATMTDRQRDAVIQAREKFSGYIESVKSAAEGAKALSGSTTDATLAVASQLPKMGELAGKNKEAREQVILLAAAFGISRADAEKAMNSAKGFKEVLDKIKSKDVRLGLTLDTAAAEKGMETFLKRYGNRSLAIAIKSKVTAAGALRTRSGVELMAAGGFMAGASMAPPPAIANKATFVPTTNTIYGEAGREAYIPYDAKYRDRALAILSQVASDFGLTVYGKEGPQQVEDMQVAIDATGMQVSGGLTSAMGVLTGTMGQAGSLTSSINQVGATAEQLNAGWLAGSQVLSGSVEMTGEAVSSSIVDLSDSVNYLGSVVGAAKAAAGGKASSGKGGSQGSTNVPPPPKKGGGGFVEGSAGLSYVRNSSGLSMGAPVNSSRVSAPQQMSPSAYAAAASSGGGRSGGSAVPASGGGRGGSLIHVDNLNVNNKADADTAAAYLYARLGSKGP